MLVLRSRARAPIPDGWPSSRSANHPLTQLGLSTPPVPVARAVGHQVTAALIVVV